MKPEPRDNLSSPRKRRFADLRAKLDRIEVCLGCGERFEPENKPGLAACPRCGSYLRWSDQLTHAAVVYGVDIARSAVEKKETDPALLEQLRNLFRKQQRRDRRKDKE